MTTSLSVIIVNYCSAKLIADCIESAFQFEGADTCEWIIVDNYSNDNSETYLIDKFPFIKWINMGYNAGFARGNNAGIKASSNSVVLLLNPDVIILDDAINVCFKKLTESTDIACTPQLLYKNGLPQISGSYFVKGGLNTLFFLPYLGPLTKMLYGSFKKQSSAVKKASAHQVVDWINGAFMMVKKQAISEAGMFDEDFFLYAEEVEWCSRLRKVGKIIVYGAVTTIHLQGATINGLTETVDNTYFNVYDKKGLQLLVSRYLRIKKQFGNFWFSLHMLFMGISVPVFIIGSFMKKLINFKNPLSDHKKMRGYSKNVFTLLKLVPKIISAKPFFFKMF